MTMNYKQMAEAARPNIGSLCKACPTCDGRGCRAAMPGPGAKGSGTGAMRNFEAWQSVRVNMDTLCGNLEPDTSTTLFGREFSFPLMIAPVGDVNRHYSAYMNTLDYNRMSLGAAARAGVASLTGDGVDLKLFQDSCLAISEVGGCGIPTVKPWGDAIVADRISLGRGSGAFAIAMDIDAAGLPFLKGLEPPAGGKTVEQLRSFVEQAGVPFIVKGVMSPKVALKAVEAGASAVIVSNHGGRVLDGCPSTAEVLPAIVRAVEGRASVLVDGGIRSGLDVFRALALGADGVLACRPFVVAAYGAGEQGIFDYLMQLKAELADTMTMCGCQRISDITADCIWA